MEKENKKQLNIPRLRFFGFNEEWKKEVLGNFADVSKLAGYEFTKHVIYENFGNIIAIRGLNIKNNTLELNDVKYIDKSELSKLKRSKLFINDLMFTYIGTIGEVALIDKNDKYYLGPNVARIRVNNSLANSKYILYYFNIKKFKEVEIKKYIATSSQPSLTMENVRKFIFLLPTLLEQQKIADFLSSVDNWINNLKQQKENLESYKKGMMQKIFSQEIRFKDENGEDFEEWEEKKIKDIFIVTRGYVLSMNNIKNSKIDNYIYPVYSSQTMNSGLAGYYNEYLYENAITWTTDGANAGNVNFRNGKFYCTNVCGVLINKDGYANNFVSELLNSIAYKHVSRVGNPKLMNNVMSEIKIKLPSIEEQQKIANFLSSIDNLIEIKEKEINNAEEWKNGLMQQMFI